MSTTHTRRDRPPTDSPTAWMAVWERARIDGDVGREDKARSELRRLGVTVPPAEFEGGPARG